MADSNNNYYHRLHSTAAFLRLAISSLVLLSSLISSTTAAYSYNVLSFGARNDGRTDSTTGFQKAWTLACTSRTPATIYVPRGNYVLRPTYFSGPCKHRVVLWIDGTIIPPSDFNVLRKSAYWLMFYRVNGLVIRGGTLDAKGHRFWSCRRSGACSDFGARSISFMHSRNIVVHGLKSYNSLRMNVAIGNTRNIAMSGLYLRAPSGSPNTDGIHMQDSVYGVKITNSVIRTGDDCISMGAGSKNILIQNIACGPGHGISIGSLGNAEKEDGVEDVTVSSVVFTGTQNGVRIKSWARPSTGYVKNIVFRNLVMRGVYNPVFIDQNYCPNNQCPNDKRNGVKVSGVTFQKIRGTSATKIAIKFDCNPDTPCTGIRLRDIRLSYMGRTASTECKYVHGQSIGTVYPRGCF